jgi:asparagine synthase (glutamine-hydrolysing)
MCGIAGFWDSSQANSSIELRSTIHRMTDSLYHRGPDDSGIWLSPEDGIALGHRRLSILDISPLGHQPMLSADERYIIVFNGEIYNFLELRKQLENTGHKFKGNSDTEVMLACFSQWGIQPAVQKFHGMFAFALWDKQEKRLHLGRDRAGEKPVYYGLVNNCLVFGSELKSITTFPGWKGKIDRNALSLYMRYCYVPDPHSIYQNIYKLSPGCILTINYNNILNLPIPEHYWMAQTVAMSGKKQVFTGSDTEATNRLDKLLHHTISQQMLSDVPIGAFLSGGIDSSTIVAIMQSESNTPIKTFTIGFNDDIYNEAIYAKAVANHLNTSHTELYVSPEEISDVIPKLPHIYDEPFADSSQLPTFLVSQLARQHVTVSLSGDAGDELFGGYNRYVWAPQIWKKIGNVPLSVRLALQNIILSLTPQAWNHIFKSLSPIIPSKLRQVNPGDKLHKLANVLSTNSRSSLYRQLSSQWTNPEQIVLNSFESKTIMTNQEEWPDIDSYPEWMMCMDLLSYLPGDILTKIDRAAMSTSLETRVPFLDQNIIEFAWQLPLSMKIRNGESKWLLRQVLYKYVPRELIERPKMGFGIPISDLIRTSLRDWAEDLLSVTSLKSSGCLNDTLIRQKWEEHLSGKRNWQYHLWNILIFQSWFKTQCIKEKQTCNS